MQRPVLLLFIIGILVCSCSRSDTPAPVAFADFKTVAHSHLVDIEEHTADRTVGGAADFVYKGGKPLKRIGGGVQMGGVLWRNSGFYDTVMYTAPNLITIVSKENLDDYNGHPNKREVILENGLVKQKITYDDAYFWSYTDTIDYYYDAARRLQRTRQRTKHYVVERNYAFDAKGNLRSILGEKKDRYDNTVVGTTEEHFGGYDDKPNPLKGICLWQDLLYLTLSANNFTSYSYRGDKGFRDITWTLAYDENGNADFSK